MPFQRFALNYILIYLRGLTALDLLEFHDPWCSSK